eukprot:scaffold670_cov333-Pavlova_lutheri.AAC.13
MPLLPRLLPSACTPGTVFDAMCTRAPSSTDSEPMGAPRSQGSGLACAPHRLVSGMAPGGLRGGLQGPSPLLSHR